MKCFLSRFLCVLFCSLTYSPFARAQGGTANVEVPKVHDDRLVVELFAAAPDIVHPIAVEFDHQGRLLVIESHTHFPPPGYKGPKHDRVLLVEDADGDGKADRFRVFFEGATHAMDLAVHADGAVYLATRNEILRLRDTDGDGKADTKERLIFLDTKGNYPHNGLSGLCFAGAGHLYFGMGENLGAAYKLIGADGTTIAGEGDGGHIFHCTADGKKLRKVATGFWNPFGIHRDVFGRIFTVDNDPDAMPPCRMLHVVEGGDYGYQFRYGRSGRHPFQAWNGELPGTLPMVTGVGEGPCEILSYESDGLPKDYLGHVLVTSWADHRVERYALKEKGASFTATRQPFVQGGKDFRPVGLAVAPDGSLFVSDWVLRDYTLHQRGAIWHIRTRDAKKPERPREPEKALLSGHRPLREWAAGKLGESEPGRAFLRRQLSSTDARTRSACLEALSAAGDDKTDLDSLADHDVELGIRAMAVRGLSFRGKSVARFLTHPFLVGETIGSLKGKEAIRALLGLLEHRDPFVHHAAVHQLAKHPELLAQIDFAAFADAKHRVGLLLAHRDTHQPEGVKLIPKFLADPDDDVRFLTLKWIADEKLIEFRPLLEASLPKGKLNIRLYWAYATALARLEGKEANEARLADYFLNHVVDPHAFPPTRALALQLVPAKHPRLTPVLLGKLLQDTDPAVQLETVRLLAEHADPKRTPLLLELIGNAKLGEAMRAQAVAGLAYYAQHHLPLLVSGALGDAAVGDEALRAMVEAKLSDADRRKLESVVSIRPQAKELVDRVLGKPFFGKRPPAKDVDAWLTRLEGPADADAGRRIFAHPRVGHCSACHRCEGRGNEVGPDLSTIGRTERRAILESILQPSNNVAPHYQVWIIEMADGQLRTGMLIRTYLDEYTYLDERGNQFTINTRDALSIQPSLRSIMPEALVDRLTDQELRDVLAYLYQRK